KIQNPKSKISYRTDDFKVIELEVVSAACPTEFGLTGVYPNPFNAAAQIKFNLSEAGMVEVGVYDLSGRLALKLASGQYAAGSHQIVLDGTALSSGVYVVRLEVGGGVVQAKAALVK
ncbi:MAG: T9SS type A sorting domain-containing protein, partial [Calditrichaeota bacterium]|nr:T9SS type A sorting domain-containing protein [Calditrichota bacterium]